MKFFPSFGPGHPRLLVSGWALALLIWGSGVSSAPAAGEITNFNGIYQLSTAEAAQHRPFTFTGVVLCYDSDWSQTFVADGPDARYISWPFRLPASLKEGDRVKLTAITALEGDKCILTNLEAAVLGKGSLPKPRHIALTELAETTGQWIECEGVVLVADTAAGKLELTFREADQNCVAVVMGPSPAEAATFVGARVRIRGINTSQTENGRLISRTIIVPGTNELLTMEMPHQSLASLPVISIGGLRDSPLGAWTNEMVHLNGWIEEYHPGDYLILRDPTGMIRAELVQTTPLQLGDRADVWGFVTPGADGGRLSGACFSLRNPPAAQEPAKASPSAHDLETITTAAGVRKLSPEEAARGYPVRLRGVVTYIDLRWKSAFIQGNRDACWVRLDQTGVHSGDYAELTGHTDPGDFAPSVVNAKLTFLWSSNLPPPITADLEDLADGHLDSRWIKTEGTIRRVEKVDLAHLKMIVMGDREKLSVILPNWNNQPIPAQWVDSRVSIHGVCATDANGRRQLEGITLFVPDVSQIETIEAAPADPFAVAVTPIASLATFSPGRAGRRMAVSGVVTLLLPGSSFVLQDATGGIRVRTEETNAIHMGENMDAVGFLAFGDFSPHLESALLRRHGFRTLPEAKVVTADAILRTNGYDNTVVEIQAVLLQKVMRSLEPKLVLRDGAITFIANLLDPSQTEAVVALAPGSLLALKGACLVEGNSAHGAETFRLALSQPGAVELVKAPPSWTTRDSLRAGGVLVLAFAAALTWVGLLRRQVHAQTKIIRANQQQLIDTSRQAGMAEIAIAVLHNVGNVLNSVNISASILSQKVKELKIEKLTHLAALFSEHENNLAQFLTQDPRGRKIPLYLKQLGQRLEKERDAMFEELASLEKNVEHIKNIVSMQQNYAKVAGHTEWVQPDQLVEDAIRLNMAALSRHSVELRREFDPSLPPLNIDKHKVLQILVNLIQNAKYACDEADLTERRLTVRVNNCGERVRISVIDTGIGIPSENLTRIFSFGFTTRKNGHGFGLHSGALAAQQLGGALLAFSDGPGKGATFTLELPISKPSQQPDILESVS